MNVCSDTLKLHSKRRQDIIEKEKAPQVTSQSVNRKWFAANLNDKPIKFSIDKNRTPRQDEKELIKSPVFAQESGCQNKCSLLEKSDGFLCGSI